MKLNDIAKELRDNAFVESEDKEGWMVHPESTDFIVNLCFDKKYEEIEIGSIQNYAFLSVSSIRSFRIIPKPNGLFFEIKLDVVDCEINLFCAFD